MSFIFGTIFGIAIMALFQAGKDVYIPCIDKRTTAIGEWIKDDYDYNRCSECGFEYERPEEASPYCPHCGAKMEWEDKENEN